MKNIQVCFFSHSSKLGGAQRSLLDLLKYLIANGIGCSMVIEDSGLLTDECLKLGISIKIVRSMPKWTGSSKSKFLISKAIKNDLTEMTDFVKKSGASIIYTQTIVNPFGAIVAEILDLPHIWAPREYGELDHRLRFIFGYNKSMKAMYKSSDAIFCITKDVAQTILGNDSADEKVNVNYNNVHTCKTDSKIKKDNSSIKIGNFGILKETKNQIDGVEACIDLLQQGWNIKFYLIGSQNKKYKIKLTKLLEKSGFQNAFVFINYTPDPMKLMSEMDIILSCSIQEALGRTLFEAIKLKKPIIYANSGGPKEVFNEKYGLPYEAGNISHLVHQIIRTIDCPDETARRVYDAYEYVNKNFNDETYGKPVLEAIKNFNGSKTNRKEKAVFNFIKLELKKEYWAIQKFFFKEKLKKYFLILMKVKNRIR